MTNELRLLKAMCCALNLEVSETPMPDGKDGEMLYEVTKRQPKQRTSKEIGYTVEFLEIWKIKPNRPGNSKQEAFKVYLTQIKKGANSLEIKAGLQRYTEYIKATSSEEFAYKLSNFIKRELYLSKWEIPKTANKLKLPVDDQLVSFAQKNGLPDPAHGESFPEYRRRLQTIIDKGN